MPKSKHSNILAPVDEPPSKRRSNRVSWANTGKFSTQADDMVDSTRPRIFQSGYAHDSRSSPSKSLFGNGDSCNFLAEHQLRDRSYVRKYSNLGGSVNDSVGQYGANCCPLHGRGDDDSAMDLRGDSRTTLYNFIDSAPRFNESIGGEIQASTTGNYTNILPNSIPFAAGTPGIWEMLLDTTYPVVGGGFDYDFCTPHVQTIPDDLQSIMVEAGTPTNSVSGEFRIAGHGKFRNLVAGVKPLWPSGGAGELEKDAEVRNSGAIQQLRSGYQVNHIEASGAAYW